ncbi:MAG: GrpB family protein [Bacillota bacterium]|nr:GrpB family protein [Bacillota bacterium]
MPRKVEVVPYREEWEKMFRDETQKLLQIPGAEYIVFNHIGSTSVPGLNAKPIIDLLAEANEIKTFDKLTPVFEEMGYKAKGENGIPGRRYFAKLNEKGEHLFHLHTFQKGNPEIRRHLIFRDFLRENPLEAARYAKIKETAAKTFPFDIESYMNVKNPIIQELEQKASKWEGSRKS